MEDPREKLMMEFKRLEQEEKDNLQKNALHQIVEGIEDIWESWVKASEEVIEIETNYKAFCSATKKALMDAGATATKAEANVQADVEWADKYRELQLARLKVQKTLKLMEIKRMKFEAERTNQANLRQIQ